MSFFKKNKTINVSPCNVYSLKQKELTSYDTAYASELSSVRQQQSQVTTKMKDDDNKIKENTTAIAGLNQSKPQLESQIPPLEKERADAETKKAGLVKDRVPAETKKANLEKQRAPAQQSKTNLQNQLAGEVRASNTGNIFKRMAAKMRLAKTAAGINGQINAQNRIINDINTKINAEIKTINDINSKIRAEDAKIKSNNDKIKSINDQITQSQKRLTELNLSQTQLKTTSDGNNLLKTQLTAKDGEINAKIGRNKEALIKVLKDKADCEYKGSACGIAKTQIGNQKKRLKQYEDELAKLNKQYEKCNTDYENKCSASNRNSLTKLIADRDTSQKLLDNNQTEYKKDCEGNMPDCGQLYSKFQRKQERYNVEKDIKNKLNQEYKTCMDPTKNDCKDIYSAANDNKYSTLLNIDTVKRNEGFTQYSSNDTVDATHARVLSNYKSVQRDYTKLKQNIKELNNANNNDNSKTSKYASKKQLYDNAIYTNILLTALATSMLYYVFIEI
jgi:chromosome segregation ATPase